MNEPTFENKAREDAARVLEDGSTKLSKLGGSLIQSTEKVKEDITAWAGDGLSQFSRKLEGIKGDALDKVVVASKSLEQGVDKGLEQYNLKVQDLVDQVPGGLSSKAARYPWVTNSIFLAIGLVLGMLIKARPRRPLKTSKI